MARKRLIKGPNAVRVEKRIADTPEDITETSIFKVLKDIEEKSKKTNTKKEPSAAKSESKSESKTEIKEQTAREKSQEARSRPKKKKKSSSESNSKKSIHFTKQEKEIILKSCISYRNTLPIYLKSVQREVKIIDNVIKKIK